MKKTLFFITILTIIIATTLQTANAICGNWTDATDPSELRDWAGVATSYNGNNLVAVSYGNYIFTSNNSGVSFDNRLNGGFWSAVASSSDGTKLAVTYSNWYIYTSNDSGATWNYQLGSGARDWTSIASSSDGTKLVASDFGGNIWASTDSGITWADTGQLAGVYVKSSDDGSKIITAVYDGNVYLSNDSGTTWINITSIGTNNWAGIGISGNGMKLIVTANDGTVFYSNDFGNTWTNQTYGAISYINGVSTSKDFSTIAIWQATGDIFVSNNSGTTFIDQISAGSRDWSAIDLSYNGSLIIAGDYSDSGGQIWIYNKCPAIPKTCTVNYTETILSYCQIDDTYILGNISSNETCESSYNTTETCNYCSANIIANTSTCNSNGTQSVNYIDTNYTTCCLTTGLPSDCIINDPAYYPANQSCYYFTQDFSCIGDPTPVINDKMNINCELPDEEAYCCVVNIYQGNNLTNLLATSPEYTYKGSSAVFPQDQETRTCFTPSNRLLNAYYTQKEIRPDTLYKVEVKCTSNSTTLLSQYGITPVYHTWDWFTHRVEWFGNNPIQITITFVAIIIAIAIGIYFIRKI